MKARLLTLLVLPLALLLIPAVSSAQAAPVPLKTFSGVAYRALESGATLKYDVFRLNDKRYRPAVILVHGGGWWKGSRADFSEGRPLAQALARAGFVVVVIDYRLACGVEAQPRRVFGYVYESAADRCGGYVSDQRSDVREAIQDVRSRSGTLRVDTDNIGLFGVSAGGHLAMLAALDDSRRVKAVVNVSGPTMVGFIRLQAARVDPPKRTIRAAFTNAVGCQYQACPKQWESVDPLRLLYGRPTARFALLTIAGRAETQVPARTMIPFSQAMRKRGQHVTNIVVPGHCHGTSCIYARPRYTQRPVPLAQAINFLKTELRAN